MSTNLILGVLIIGLIYKIFDKSISLYEWYLKNRITEQKIQQEVENLIEEDLIDLE